MSVPNQHTLLVGRTGSGKSTLAKILADRYTARAIILDQRQEYELRGGVVCYDLVEAMDAFKRLRWRAHKIVFRPRDPDDYLRLVEFVQRVQKIEPHGPLVVFAEEASHYSDAYEIDPVLRAVYNEGRHDRVSLCTVIQLDTDIHRLTRRNSQVICTFAQTGLSKDMSRYFTWREVENLVALDTIPERDFPEEPEQGVHFLCYPPNMDFYDQWVELHGWIAKPIGE